MNRAQRRAAAAAATKAVSDRSKPATILGASCHWGSSGEHGFAIHARFERDDGNRFSKWLQETALKLDMDPMVTPKRAAETLDGFHAMQKSGAPLSDVVSRGAFLLIHWMETRGHIDSDEFNGIVWLVERNGVLAGIREDKPTPENRALFEKKMGAAGVQVVRAADAGIAQQERLAIVDDLLGRVVS